MKKVVIEVTNDLLKDLLKLPKDVNIGFVYQSHEDIISHKFKLLLTGEKLPDCYRTYEGESARIIAIVAEKLKKPLKKRKKNVSR